MVADPGERFRIEEQHRAMSDAIADAVRLAQSEWACPPEEWLQVKMRLVALAKRHFESEDLFMKNGGIDARHCNAHREEHRCFLLDIDEWNAGTAEMGSAGMRLYADFLQNWMAYHCHGMDASLFRQWQTIQAGRNASEAYEAEIRSGAVGLLADSGALYLVMTQRYGEARRLCRQMELRVRQYESELEESYAFLQPMVTHDDFTGLPNRRFANMSLRRLWEEHRRFGCGLVVMVVKGDERVVRPGPSSIRLRDEWVRGIAERLLCAVAPGDMVCRYGSMEIVVVFPNQDETRALQIAKALVSSEEGRDLWVGFAKATESMLGYDELVRKAQASRYTGT